MNTEKYYSQVLKKKKKKNRTRIRTKTKSVVGGKGPISN